MTTRAIAIITEIRIRTIAAQGISGVGLGDAMEKNGLGFKCLASYRDHYHYYGQQEEHEED